MYYNKYKLYCPIPTLVGGESDEGGGYGEDGNGEDGNGDGKSKGKAGKGGGAMFDDYGNLLAISGGISTTSLSGGKNNFGPIKPTGETRPITITGKEGSKFSLTIKDNSDCSILKKKMEWEIIPKGGKYVFQQEYPSITVNGSAVKTKEIYEIKLTPSADSGEPKSIILTQTAGPVVTITKTTSQTNPTLSVSGSDTTIIGRANSNKKYDTAKTYALTITGSDAGTSESLYVKDTKFNENIVSSN